MLSFLFCSSIVDFFSLGIIFWKIKIKCFELSCVEEGTKTGSKFIFLLLATGTPSPSFSYSSLRDITNKRLHVEKHIWKQKGHVTTESWGTLIWCLENSWQLKAEVSLFSTLALGGRDRDRETEREFEWEEQGRDPYLCGLFRNKCLGGYQHSNWDFEK